ncbi:hypothetical protein [Pseudothioclava nitratireducens]|uniref:hypothetical protein n=1 Tax=Pseudothioclava nitratireducens TaxID=1928646 RepID=UPI0023DCAC9E|nr:hypothetical protein [Defluviimonas nitratireducens]MDF1620937.1 hypothetical protein [Defluviimonas nitratireducens]
MKHTLLAMAVIGMSFATAGVASAGAIDRACAKAGRAESRALCGCIQQVADMTLSGSDQRRAAEFFKDPHKAQEVRQSDRASDESFWKRYKNFAATAESLCAR